MSKIKHPSDVNRIYICGMISNLPMQVAKDNFEAVEQYLMENFDYEIINPMKLPHYHDKSWQSYMKHCLLAMMNCNMIYVMGNHKLSNGATIENKIAKVLGFHFIKRNKDLENKLLPF